MNIPKDIVDKGSITQKLSVSNKTFLAGFDWCWKNVIEGITDGVEAAEKFYVDSENGNLAEVLRNHPNIHEAMRKYVMECVETSRERMVDTMIANAEENRKISGE